MNVATATAHQKSNSECDQINIDLVLSVETEFKVKLSKLNDLEKNLIDVNQQRLQWLENVQFQYQYEELLYQKKLMLMKTKVELISCKLQNEISHLEDQYDLQTLNYLIELTQPISDDFSLSDYTNLSNKQASINSEFDKGNVSKLKQSLKSSLVNRIKWANELSSLHVDLNQLQVEYRFNLELALTSTLNKLQEYFNVMTSRIQESKNLNKSITSEYLVLRHNCRIITSRLTNDRNSSYRKQEDLKSEFESYLNELEQKYTQIDSSSRDEINVVTNALRQTLVSRENHAVDLAAAVSLRESVVLKQKTQMKSCLKKYKKLHQELQLKRVVESKSMNFEIKSLRQMILLLQQELSASHAMLSDE